jgi:hypothetical protein
LAAQPQPPRFRSTSSRAESSIAASPIQQIEATLLWSQCPSWPLRQRGEQQANPLLKLSNLLHRHYAAILSLRHSLPYAGRGQNRFGRRMAFTPRQSPRDSVVDFRMDFGIQPLQMELITVKIEKPQRSISF